MEQHLVEDAFASNWISSVGPQVDSFENEICEYINIPYSAALSSGTAALHLALKLSGVKEGDFVLVPPNADHYFENTGTSVLSRVTFNPLASERHLG